MTTLAELKEALEHPFPPALVEFLPKDIRQENGTWMCLALPYCNKRVYEDRLNELAYGAWQTLSSTPYIHGNKLILSATVMLCGIAHTDYGEAFLTIQAKNGKTHEDENSATEAYSQAFRRACAQFGLGRYLYNLSKLRLPYDPSHRRLAISKAEQIAWVEKLYHKAGLLSPRGVSSVPGLPLPAKVNQEIVLTAPMSPAPVATSLQTVPSPSTHTVNHDSSQPSTHTLDQGSTSHSLALPTAYPDEPFLDWVAQRVERDPQRLQGICDFYHVPDLAHLNQSQRENVTRRLKRQHKQSRQQDHASA